MYNNILTKNNLYIYIYKLPSALFNIYLDKSDKDTGLNKIWDQIKILLRLTWSIVKKYIILKFP